MHPAWYLAWERGRESGKGYPSMRLKDISISVESAMRAKGIENRAKGIAHKKKRRGVLCYALSSMRLRK